ncbi:histidinol dehydrogenase [Sebaldella sp. S0638]|uniref:histidinol dehydrogenase n=1 Tax=Sebaldella sp. S0638 TaxID=2957809 RepID=UPI00209FA807|nr:histidinol dehydrogenase [Sebaldella sp. S0638]MCP1224974.1 histidinol dehydrogenase [Sebaldella sp. S0638]
MIKTIRYSSDTELSEIFPRSQFEYEDINKKVRDIIEDVKANGDKALYKYSEMFDVKLESLVVSSEEIEEAYNRIDEEFKVVLLTAAENIRKFHEKQVRNNFFMNGEDGILLGQMINPIEKAGIYIPGGTASYPSTVLMNVIPAKIAGVEEIILVTPPNKAGKIEDSILAAAKIAGADRIFKIGGAQSIAALSYGTETIPKVYKITGPGNIYVAMAKKMVYGEVDIDMVAGPSEILVIADENAIPENVAADLLSQAEHDKLAASVLVTSSEDLAEKVRIELEKQLEKLPRRETAEESLKNNGRIIITNTIEDAVKISNEIAPEHLELCVSDPFSILGKIKNAGSIFLGNNTPEALGDYLAGPNHTLPTSGTAKFSSPLSVDDFIKKSSVIYYTKEALEKVKDKVICFAEKEGLSAHAESVRIRVEGGKK